MRSIPKRVSLGFLALLLTCWTPSALYAQFGTAPDEGVRFSPPTAVVLSGAHIVISPDRELEQGSLLIEDGKISAIGENIVVPPGAEIIDVHGKYLYPALIDPLAEFDAKASEFTAGYWNENIAPQRLMVETANLETSKLEAFRKAGVAIVLAAPSDKIIKGQSSVVLTNTGPASQTVLRDQVFQHLRLYPSRGTRGYPNSPMGAVALIRQALADADWYSRAMQAVEGNPALPSPEYNYALEALQPVIRGKQTVVMDGTSEQYALRADRIAREFSLRLVVRGSGREYRRLEAIKSTNRTFILPVNFPDAPKVETRADAADTTLQELMHWRLAPENPARLDAAQVPFVLTSDGLEKKSEYLPKLRTAVQHGLSEEAALRAVTEGPAALLEISHIAGTLEAGKLANVLIVSGPLFDDSSKIEETWVAGTRHDWNEEQDKDLRGQWSVTLANSPKQSWILKLSGKPDDLSGEIGVPEAFATGDKDDDKEDEDKEEVKGKAKDEDKDDDEEERPSTTKLKGLAFNGYQLSATFEAGEALEGRSGAAILGVALLQQKDGLELVGSVNWADGTSNSISAKPTEQAAEDEDEHESKKDSEKKNKEQVAVEVNYPLGAYGLSEAPEQSEWLLLKNATIWTCGEAGILESADMLVHAGIIESVGKDLSAPEDASVVDATGMHISPGIIDCHSHMATDGGVNESGQAVTAEVRIGDFIDPNDITIYRQLAGGVTTSNILHGSANPIGGQNQVIKLRWGSLDEEMKMKEAPAGIKFALGENVKQSSRPDGTRYPRSRMGVEQIMRDRFEAALLYRQKWSEWTTDPRGLPPRRDYELEAIAEILEKKRWIHCHSYRQDEILTMLRTLDDYDVTIGSLQHILEGYKVADAMAEHGATGSSFSDWWAYKFEVYDAIPYNGALMHNAGVVVSFNSDDRELARHLNHEAAKAVKYGGVPPEEALKFVTLNPAKQLRIDQWVGSLESGKHADFVIWNRSPLSTLSACQETWIDGRKYFDREQDQRRREQDAKMHQALVQSIISSGAKTRDHAPDDDPAYWWARHDEFCHHGHDEHDDATHHDHELHREDE